MLKNLILLVVLTWVSFSHAKKEPTIAHDSINDAEAYKVERPVEEQEAKRSVAGSKIKKQSSAPNRESKKEETNSPDSEVRYWQYSE